MNKILHITKVNILDIFRDFKSNAIVFVLPTVFILVFGFLFGRISDLTAINIGVVISGDEIYNHLTGTLDEIENEDGDRILNVARFESREDAEKALIDRNISLVITPNIDPPLLLIIDESSQASITARAFINELFTIRDQQVFATESVVRREINSGFELQAAGLIVYGILILIPQVAGSLARIREKNYVFRYATSQITSFEIIAGFTLSNFFVGIIQTMLLFYVASWFGLSLNLQTLLAFIFVLPVILFSVGTGLLIGSFVAKPDAGQNVGTILSIILGFLSGGFIGGIERIGTVVGDKFIAITDFVPTFYAAQGITKLVIFENKFSEVLLELSVISAVSLAIFIAGVTIYHFKQLKLS